MVQITKDNAYDAVAPDDFPAMLDVERYGNRTTAFDKIISATHDHFWDPLDKKYIDFSAPFDLTATAILPGRFFPIFHTRIGEAMSEDQKIKFANEASRWQLSAILHGEQGALALSASLCHILRDPGAQEYAANQTREEARHVTAFSAYIKSRWGTPLPAGETLKNLLTEMVNAPEVYKKIVGMQMLVEGLAMAPSPRSTEFARPAAGQALPARHDRRSLPSQIRQDLGRPHHPETDGGRAQHRRGLGGAMLSDSALQPDQCRADADRIRVRRHRWQEARASIMEAFTDDDRRDS